MSLFQRIGFIVTAVIIVLGGYCLMDLIKIFNVKSAIIGYFYSEPEVVKISDFEYDINSLLFYSADNENQFYATANAKPVSNFDSTKQYNLTINGIECKAVDGNYDYINVNFTNQFNSSLDTILLEDTLNIKVNFYKEGTKILFITNGGEQAIKLWSSYIQKNGFILKIIETNYKSRIEVDNIPNYTLNLYFNNELYETITYNILNYQTFNLPTLIDGIKIDSWQDEEGNAYTSLTNSMKDGLNLYAQFDNSKLTLYLNSETLESNVVRNDGLNSTLHQSYIQFKPISSDYQKQFFENVLTYKGNLEKVNIVINGNQNGIFGSDFSRFVLNSQANYIGGNSISFLTKKITYSGYGVSHYYSFTINYVLKVENNLLYSELYFTYSNDKNFIYEEDWIEYTSQDSFNKILNGFITDSENGVLSENLEVSIKILD